jgi:uncharacterized protein YciI
MKWFGVLLLIVSVLGACTGIESEVHDAQLAEVSTYDSTLALNWGADDYGMRSYVMALLTTGPDTTRSAESRAEIGQAHLAHIQTLSESGKLVLAGPFYEANNYRGIFIFNTDDLDEARAWVAADPAVQAEILTAELLPWYGSAALVEVPNLHRKVEKVNPAE